LVSDPGKIISANSKSKINQLITVLEQKKNVKIAIVILPLIREEVLKDFAKELFNYWGIE